MKCLSCTASQKYKSNFAFTACNRYGFKFITYDLFLQQTAMEQLISKQLDYEASIKGIVSTFAELSFHNKWIEFKFESKFQKLESILTEFKLALSKSEEYIGKYQDVNLDMKFIY